MAVDQVQERDARIETGGIGPKRMATTHQHEDDAQSTQLCSKDDDDDLYLNAWLGRDDFHLFVAAR